ncbi:MAG TPA: hypothetical protein PKK96_09875 [Anaerolineales bacterium]|nr:hypothetical protein [Anaerolineales bacterium]HNQ94389.1 hypothetical protein [Anaerolineales bacterium]HNS61299.1 hypothetical protein [Anaerolineales bacterium]
MDEILRFFFDVQPDSAWETFFPLAASGNYNKRETLRHCEEAIADEAIPNLVTEIASPLCGSQ